MHEWGTFTSVADANGQPVPWVPLNEKSADLPCFVHRIGDGTFKYVTAGLVRMETPVDYFYTDTPTKITVTVDFPGSMITEWYPQALPQTGSQRIVWRDLSLLPGTNPTLLTTKNPSRYFAARATDSTPLQSGNESEKLLFYRGIGLFKVPVAPVSEGNGIRIYNSGDQPIPVAILFENQSGHIGYRVVRDLKNDTEVYAPELKATLGDLRGELIANLSASRALSERSSSNARNLARFLVRARHARHLSDAPARGRPRSADGGHPRPAGEATRAFVGRWQRKYSPHGPSTRPARQWKQATQKRSTPSAASCPHSSRRSARRAA